jgi:amino acid adenylation domain-containing protein
VGGRGNGTALTPREREVLRLISAGLTNRGVAERLGVTVHAVKFHLHSIYRKLDVSNRTEAAVQYAETVAHAHIVAAPPRDHDLAYWRSRLEGAPRQLELPAERPRPPIRSFRAGSERLLLPRPLLEAADRLGERSQVGLEAVLAAAAAAVLHRTTGETDLVVGFREESDGGSAHTFPLRIDLSGEPSFSELLAHVGSVIHGARAHPLPLELLVEAVSPERDGERIQLFQILIAVEQRERRRTGRLDAEPLDEHAAGGRLDLTLRFRPGATGLECLLDYSLDLFSAESASRTLGHLETLLAGALAAPETPLWRLPLLADGERTQLLERWNATAAPYPAERCVHDLVRIAALVRPQAPAVRFGEETLSYAELEDRSNRLAHRLQRLGVGPETLVGLCLERALLLPVALLGILKAGGAYVPIDPAYPTERQAFMLEDSQAPVLVTQKALLDHLPQADAHVLCLDRDWADIASEPAEPPVSATAPEQLAYVIYTSGSTGRPKGVQIPHQALVNFLSAMAATPGFGVDDVLLAVTTLSFDIAGLELYLPLVQGGQVAVASQEAAADPKQLIALLARHEVTVMQATPTTWRLLIDAGWPGRAGLKALCGGEALPPALAAQLLERGLELWNMYGPTETTIWSTVQRLRPAEPLTIGRPIANTRVYVLDPHLQPVPVGVPGELHIGGHGLARGYLNRPELTEERFVPDPFHADGRLYKTGDLVRHRPEGTIEFLGRLDHQVKVRGFRIELGEVEAVLAAHPNVRDVVVAAVEETPGDARLIAYVVPRGRAPSAGELRAAAARTLPGYMVPSAIVTLEAFPLTPNGKVDRKALPAPTYERAGDREFAGPRTPLERSLVAIWEDELGVRPIGVTDDFFDLGATSIVAARLFARIEKELGRGLPVAPVFQAPTVEQLARLIGEASSTRRFTCLIPIQPEGSKPPIFCVHGGGGTVLHLQPLARQLGRDQPFYGLQARGLYGDVSPLRRVEEMAEYYLAEVRLVQPAGPYFLAGYCFGAIVAYEMAQRVLEAGEEVALLAMFNGPSPAYIRTFGPAAPRTSSEPPPEPRRLSRTARRVLQDPRSSFARFSKRMAWKARIARVNMALALRRPVPEAERDWFFLNLGNEAERLYNPKPYPGSIVMFRGAGLYREPTLGWGDLTQRGIESYEVPGMHTDNRQAMAEPHVAFVSERLQIHLDHARRTAAPEPESPAAAAVLAS